MTAREAARKHFRELKGKPLRQKLEHILTYFWGPITAVSVIALLAASYMIHLATVKDVALHVTCLNTAAADEQVTQWADAYASYAGIDLNQSTVEISTGMADFTYSMAEMVMARVAAQEVDIMAADTASLYQYAYLDFFADLTEVLNSRQQGLYGERFLYIDLAVLEDTESAQVLPDPTKPEEMDRPVPVAIRLPEDSAFAAACFPQGKDDVAIGIVANTQNLDNALQFLEFVMQYEEVRK